MIRCSPSPNPIRTYPGTEHRGRRQTPDPEGSRGHGSSARWPPRLGHRQDSKSFSMAVVGEPLSAQDQQHCASSTAPVLLNREVFPASAAECRCRPVALSCRAPRESTGQRRPGPAIASGRRLPRQLRVDAEIAVVPLQFNKTAGGELLGGGDPRHCADTQPCLGAALDGLDALELHPRARVGASADERPLQAIAVLQPSGVRRMASPTNHARSPSAPTRGGASGAPQPPPARGADARREARRARRAPRG